MARQAKRQTAGLTVAALVHGLVFLAIFLPRAPTVSAAQLIDGTPGVLVSLVHWPSAASPPSTVESEADRLEQLRQKLLEPSPAQSPPLPSAPASHRNAAAILDEFERSDPTAPPSSSPPKQAGPPGSGGVIEDPYGGAAVPVAYLRAVTGNVLWPQVRRCWKPEPVQPPIELLVTLDANGGLSEPPIVVRGASAKVDGLRLKAEAEAVQAVIACAPYDTASIAKRSFRLDFAP